jgi:hypothetical protein
MLNTPRSYGGGMVTAPHHLASQAGAAVLRQGGNAAEAMIAMAAAIAVVYPHMNSIGGDSFWLAAAPGDIRSASRPADPRHAWRRPSSTWSAAMTRYRAVAPWRR